MEKFSNNFTYEELVNSPTANRLKINNTPNKQQKESLRKLAVEILQVIRDEYGKPLIVTSGFRCDKLNKAVGGAKNSQHTKGEAADIRSVSDSVKDNKEIFDLVLQMIKEGKIKVGQLIDEYGYNWIHVSLPRVGKTNNQILHIK